MAGTIDGLPLTEKNTRNYWLKVDQETDPEGCWVWTAATSGDDYGELNLRGRTRAAHRIAFELANGPISSGLVVRHGPCANRRCVNPAHLTIGTKADNTADHVHGWLWRDLEDMPLTDPERDLVRMFLPMAEAVLAETERRAFMPTWGATTRPRSVLTCDQVTP